MDIFEIFFNEFDVYKAKFKNKGYPHFDSEFSKARVKKILDNLKSNIDIQHPFYPLIRYEIPKYKRNEEGAIYIDKKSPRYIMHTARVDANIYHFYRNIIMNFYDSLLKDSEINDCVIAYRKIPVSDNTSDHNKCNIHFADEAIEEIKRQTTAYSECCAIAMDIKGFFDNLDHALIKKQWSKVMKSKKGLDADHFTIFRNITEFSYIDAKKLEKVLNIDIKKICDENNKIRKASSTLSTHTQKLNLKLCNNTDFRKLVVPSLEKNSEKGIPQGSPISDVIANIYMLDFDLNIKEFANQHNGYYRRYSDDILFVCPSEYQEKITDFIRNQISLIKLNISEEKNLISIFKKAAEDLTCLTYKGKEQKIVKKPFEYLGLSFDGKNKNIRNATISNFYCRLSARIKKEAHIATQKFIKKENKIPTSEEVYKKINFDMIRNSYMKNKEESTKKEFSGNFYTYVERVARITENIKIKSIFEGKRLNSFIKKRARKHCAYIADKALQVPTK